MSSLRILVVGDAMLDVVVQPKESIAPTSDTPTNVRMSRGGSAANLAVALAQSDHDVYFLGVVANDLPGKMFYEELVRSGVTPVLQSAEGSTGVVVALISSDGQRAMLTDRGVNPQLASEFALEQLETGFDHVHVSGYTFLDPATSLVGEQLLAYCAQKNISTSVDVCSVAPLMAMGIETFLGAVRNARILFANEEEALNVTKSTSLSGALAALGELFSEAVVTCGAQGAVAISNGEISRAPSQSTEVLDTTGAGDAATGAYLGVRLLGESQLDALTKAMAASAVVVRGLGSRG